MQKSQTRTERCQLASIQWEIKDAFLLKKLIECIVIVIHLVQQITVVSVADLERGRAGPGPPLGDGPTVTENGTVSCIMRRVDDYLSVSLSKNLLRRRQLH